MADSAQTLIRAVDQTGPAWMSAQRNAAAAIAGIKGMIPGLAAALSAAGFINMVKGSIDAMDRLNDLSKTTGLTAEALAGLQLAAKQSGGDLDSIAASVNKLAVEMGKAPEKFRELGITAKDPLEAFKQLADILNRIEDPQQRAAVAAAALGKSWQGAMPLLSEGSQKIDEMVRAGTKLSGVTNDSVRQAAAFNEQLDVLNTTLGATATKIVGDMLPALNHIAKAMNQAAQEGKGFWRTMGDGVATFLTGDDLHKANVEFAKMADRAWVLQNQILKATNNKDAGEVLRLQGMLDAVNGRLKLLRGYREMLEGENKATGSGSSATGGANGASKSDAAAKFLGTNTVSLEERKALQREIDQYNEHVRALEQAQQQRSIEQRLKNMDDLRDAELKAARDKIELDQAILAHNREVEAAEEASTAARIAARMGALDAGKAVADSLMSETQRENLAYAERLTNLKLYLESANLAQAESNAMLAQAQLEHEASLGSIAAQAAVERRKFAELSAMQQAKTYIGILTTLTASTAQKNREMFELNKVASIANAIMYTFEGANKAIGQGGIFGLGMASIIIAAGLANVAQIASTSFGSGAAPSAGGGGAGVTPVNQVPSVPVGGGGQTTLVQLAAGDFYSEESVRKLLERIAETKGGRVVVL